MAQEKRYLNEKERVGPKTGQHDVEVNGTVTTATMGATHARKTRTNLQAFTQDEDTLPDNTKKIEINRMRAENIYLLTTWTPCVAREDARYTEQIDFLNQLMSNAMDANTTLVI
jgi:hypothetical protein